jgi:hypothetical protein
METETTKKQSNRAIQRNHVTYKKKSEISEALHLIRPYVNESTYKFLSHFLHTNGTGATQIKITEWCKKAGVSSGSYSKTIKPEIENTFSQSLIIKTAAPMKYDKKRKKKVRASEFKSLLPISVLKHEIRLKESLEEQQELENFTSQIELEYTPLVESEIIHGDIESDIESDIEYNRENHWESKDESAFQQQQNNSFRENRLDNIYNLYNTSLLNINVLSKESEPEQKETMENNQSKKYFGLRKEVKELLNHPDLSGLHEAQKIPYGNKIQIFLKNYDLSLNDSYVYETILEVSRNCFMTYARNPEKVHSNPYNAFYVSLENQFVDDMLEMDGYSIQKFLSEGEIEELNELRAEKRKAYLEFIKASEELAATVGKSKTERKQSYKPENKKPVRVEFLPDWFEGVQNSQETEQELTQEELDYLKQELLEAGIGVRA